MNILNESKEELKELLFCLLEDLSQTQEEVKEIKTDIFNIKASKDDFNLVREEVIDDKYEKLQSKISEIEAYLSENKGELGELNMRSSNAIFGKKFTLPSLLFGIIMCTICFTIVFDNTILSTALFILTVSPFLFTLYVIYTNK